MVDARHQLSSRESHWSRTMLVPTQIHTSSQLLVFFSCVCMYNWFNEQLSITRVYIRKGVQLQYLKIHYVCSTCYWKKKFQQQKHQMPTPMPFANIITRIGRSFYRWEFLKYLLLLITRWCFFYQNKPLMRRWLYI